MGRLRGVQWVLIGIGAVGLMLTAEWVARTFSPPQSLGSAAAENQAEMHVGKPIDPKMVPDFNVGDQAPDFSLPDSKEVTHRLSELVKKDTVLCFTCGCANCLDVQTYMGI